MELSPWQELDKITYDIIALALGREYFTYGFGWFPAAAEEITKLACLMRNLIIQINPVSKEINIGMLSIPLKISLHYGGRTGDLYSVTTTIGPHIDATTFVHQEYAVPTISYNYLLHDGTLSYARTVSENFEPSEVINWTLNAIEDKANQKQFEKLVGYLEKWPPERDV